MIPIRFRGPLAALITVAGAAACSPAASAQVAAQPHPASVTSSQEAAIARAQADSARLPWTGADARFMTGMIGHHAQAIEMSRLAPSRITTQSIRTLAARIINAQQNEIGTMQQWLRERRQPVPAVDAGGAMTMPQGSGHEAGHDAGGHAAAGHAMAPMPGMLTADQLAQLAAARGREFDRLFLTLMIQHHRGAVAMVEELFGTYGAGQDETVFKFASDVHVDQITEIARMEQMLVALIFERGTP